jgi:hypothetical protein
MGQLFTSPICRKITEVSQIFGLVFTTVKVMYKFGQKVVWATVWAIFSQTHLVTLLRLSISSVPLRNPFRTNRPRNWDRCYDFINIFAEKKSAKKLAFLAQNKAKLCKMLIAALVFEKNADFFAQNCQKS